MVKTTHRVEGKDGDIVDALTHKSPYIACQGRFAATGYPEGATAWVSAEVKRGTDLDVILLSLADMQTQVLASAVGNLLDPSCFDDVQRELIGVITDRLGKHARIVAEMMEIARR